MGRILDEPSKVMGVFPLADLVIMGISIFLDTMFFMSLVGRIGFVLAVAICGSAFLAILVGFLGKNIMPAGFWTGLVRFNRNPRILLPGREKSEIPAIQKELLND